MLFYLGTHKTHWLRVAGVPLFLSRRRLEERARLPRAAAPWALDSGGFTELSRPPHRWLLEPVEYAEIVERYAAEIGLLEWAAPMDRMCEPSIIEATGSSVAQHQFETVANFLELRELTPRVIPVLQGWTLRDYEACLDLYRDAGVDLAAEPVVGLGSVCRRQSTAEIGSIVRMVRDEGIAAHGFGVKSAGLNRYGGALASADSMAWSYNARRNPPMAGCSHARCSNCLRFALAWRARLLRPGVQLELA